MAQQYASKQPQGYSNYLKTVAIVGVGGQVGKHIVENILKNGKQNVIALTRADSKSAAPAGVEVRKIDYDNQQTIVDALQGVEALIITMAVTAPPEQQTKLIDAAAAASVPWVLPNEYGAASNNEQLGKDTMLGPKAQGYRTHIEELGESSWIGVACSFWYEYSLAVSPEAYGFDFAKKEVTFFGEGTAKINTSTWPQTGRAVANLLALKVLPEDEHDKAPTLTGFKNRFIHVSSFLVSQRDMLDSVLRVTGGKEGDWKITHEDCEERYKSGVEMLQSGNRMGFVRLLYTRVFYPNGDGNYEDKIGLDNEVLGLPKEDLDEWTKVATDMAADRSWSQLG
ncbi:uncharacterized protein KY384_006205 [Bacidia gigantensis]|uniref:uncharacterized protein n=1 Tax=Bacidia gigantensis TaxID=2732470 RepID=UPI001D04D10D|nr:uncharacterized protein KY384_006205 [Bacidia gigantensis]KAG8529568.1 hypothetical protein KY384_006205 [Bacidia gigantensis]